MWKKLVERYNKLNSYIYGFFQRAFMPILIIALLIAAYQVSDKIQPISSYRYTETAEANGSIYYGSVEGRMATDSATPTMKMRSSTLLGSSVNTAGIDMQEKIILEGSLTIESTDVETAKTQLEKTVQEYDGKIQNYRSYIYQRGSTSAYSFSLKIPQAKLEEFIEQVKTLGKKTAENRSMRDITLQYYDNANLIKNLSLRRDRLRKLLDTDTKKLADIIEVDRELSKVQTQIENLQRTQNYNDYNVTYASLNVELVPELQIELHENKWSPKLLYRQAVNLFIRLCQNTVNLAIMLLVCLIVLLVVVLPALIIFSVIIWCIYFIIKTLYILLYGLISKLSTRYNNKSK